MFTGIIESVGTVSGVSPRGTNIDFTLKSTLTRELKPDQSIAHNGVCLTVVETGTDWYRVTAVAETLAKTNLGRWRVNDAVNLERSLKIGDRLDGHFVQGHVDATGICLHKEVLEGSWLYRFQFPASHAALMIEKGSICINGVSLTAFEVGKNEFTVTVIPYTYHHTNFHILNPEDTVNLEFDVLGKYLLRRQELTAGNL